jgi:hypothetical protein
MHDMTLRVTDSATTADPFAMLINPQAVLQAIERSSRLGALASRVCRPLDKPLIPKVDGDDSRARDGRADSDHLFMSDTELGAMY